MRACHRSPICLIALVGAVLMCWPQAPAGAVAPQGKAGAVAPQDSVTLESRSVGGAVVSLITVDLNDPTVKVDVGLPERGIAHAESFRSLVNRHSPLAAVTGTYFDVRTYVPTGSIVAGGKLVYESHIGTAVCFTPSNKVKFIAAKYGEACDLSGAQCAIRTGPRLLANGEYALSPRREGFRHPGLYGARTRMVLGVTARNHLLLVFVRTPVTFSRAASLMKVLGAVDAVCLDGGTSSAMYYRGRIVRHPGRMLTNLIEVRSRPLSEIPTQMMAAARGVLSTSTLRLSRPRILDHARLLGNHEPGADLTDQTCEQAAILGEPIRLRPSKSLHSLFPVNRAKLPGLKGFDHA